MGFNVVKSELITKLKESHPQLPAKDVEGMVSRLFDLVTEALANGERLNCGGWVLFTWAPERPGEWSTPGPGWSADCPPEGLFYLNPVFGSKPIGIRRPEKTSRRGRCASRRNSDWIFRPA